MPVEVAPAVAATSTTMEITVSKFELLRELTATQGVVERKTTIPILSNYLFEAAGDKLSLTATDLDLSLRTSCNAKVKKEGACTVPARKLYDYVKLLPDADITIRLLENHWVSIRCGRSNTKMVGMARSNFPGLPVFPSAGVIKIPAAVLRSMIAKTGFAIASEESRYTLNGALMVLKPESITMVATDGHRLAHVERTRLLVHVLDMAPELWAGEGEDPPRNHATIERELAAHDARLAALPRRAAARAPCRGWRRLPRRAIRSRSGAA